MSEGYEGSGPLMPGRNEATSLPSQSFDWESQDSELQKLGLAAARASSPAIVEDLALVHARFEMGVTTYHHRDGTTTEVPQDRLRKLLHAMPPYMESAAQITVEPERAYLLLRGILTAENRSQYSETDTPVNLLTRAFTWQARHDQQLSLDDQADLGRFLAKAANKKDDVLVTRVYAHLSRLGFASSESVGFIEDDLGMNNAILDQVGRLTQTLSVAKIDPNVLRESCKLMLGDGDDYNAMVSNYGLLTEMVYSLVPSLDIPANDLLQTVNARIKAGESINEIAASYTSDKSRAAITGTTIYNPRERRERHFTSQPAGQPLELASLPYRTERSLQEGMADLGGIAVDKIDYGEGLWVFAADAEAPTWYSMGCETTFDHTLDTVGYRYLPHPIGEVSSRPYLFHCHPEAFAGFGNPQPQDGIFPATALPVIDRLMTITPSGRDYEMIAEFIREASGPFSIRSFIAHSQGFTEYTFPNNDPEAIEEVGRSVRSWRDDVMLGVNWKRMLTRGKFGGLVRRPREANEVAIELGEQLGARLPQGFSLRFISPGTRIE